MAEDLSKKLTLAALAPRREPYWNRVSGVEGLYIGFRKLEQGGGTWVARLRNDEKRQQYRALGSGHTFQTAVRGAQEWAADLSKGVEKFDSTVADACRLYVEQQKLNKSKDTAKDAEGRFDRLVYAAPIGKVALAKLKTTTMRSWFNAQVPVDDDDDEVVRKAKASANRNLSMLKAALNMALKDRLVSSDAGWKTVVPFKEVGARRQHFLTSQQRHALLGACPGDLKDLVQALMLTPARPGEIAAATVQDFDRINGALTLRGKTGERTVTLSTPAIAFFAANAKGKIANAPLLSRTYGEAWGKDAWKKPFKAAAKVAGLPADVVLYSLRHTAISQLIESGMDSFLVAKLAGTSTQMIDKHYGHLRHDKTRERLDMVQSI